MKNYVDLRTEPDLLFLPEEVRSADNIAQMQEIAKLRFETRLEEYGWKDKITDWTDDGNEQTNDRLKQAVKVTIAILTTEELYENRDMAIQEFQFGPVRMSYRKERFKNPWKYIKPFVNDVMWTLS